MDNGGKTIPKFWSDLGLYFSTALLLWILFILVFSLNLPYRAKLLPLIIGFIGLPLIGIVIVGRIFVGVARKVDSIEGMTGGFESNVTSEKIPNVEQHKEAELSYASLLRLALWFNGCALLFFFFGYLPSMTIFLFLFLKFYGRYTLKSSVSITAGLVIPLCIIFSLFLDLRPFAGALW